MKSHNDPEHGLHRPPHNLSQKLRHHREHLLPEQISDQGNHHVKFHDRQKESGDYRLDHSDGSDRKPADRGGCHRPARHRHCKKVGREHHFHESQDLPRRLLRDPDAGKKTSRQKGLHTDADHIKSRLRQLAGAKDPKETGAGRPAQGQDQDLREK